MLGRAVFDIAARPAALSAPNGVSADRTGGTHCHDGVVRRLQPDVQMVLEEIAKFDPPPIESMPVEAAREFMVRSAAERPPGPPVGEILDGTLPGAGGDLAYRLYRPATPGPHPVVVYFHGGGWVLGDAGSDDPLCRDLCVRTDALIVSVDYRHAPEHRFPAADPSSTADRRPCSGWPPTPIPSAASRTASR